MNATNIWCVKQWIKEVVVMRFSGHVLNKL